MDKVSWATLFVLAALGVAALVYVFLDLKQEECEPDVIIQNRVCPTIKETATTTPCVPIDCPAISCGELEEELTHCWISNNKCEEEKISDSIDILANYNNCLEDLKLCDTTKSE